MIKCWAAGGAAATGELVGDLFDSLDAEVPGVGALAGFLVDMLMPDEYKTYDSVQQFLRYYSVALDQDFWTNFFNQYLGTPGTSTGAINDYKK